MSDPDWQTTHWQVAAFYDQVYYRLDAADGMPPSLHLRRLAKKLNIQPDHQVLDIACGRGDWLAAAAERGARVTGIDISERAIESCQLRLPQGHFEIGPAESLPFPDAAFDRVTCLGSLEHFLDQPASLREMRRVVKPDGVLLILVPNAGFPTYRLKLFRGTQQQAIRETIRSLSDWDAMFSDAGLDITKRWKDLHVLNKKWIFRKPWYLIPFRLAQALALVIWPLNWQYQVYHQCSPRSQSGQ
jgi:ubiquinone/menaquinone biosynthesis C-methylase UbiE